jgi:hypothetical protein
MSSLVKILDKTKIYDKVIFGGTQQPLVSHNFWQTSAASGTTLRNFSLTHTSNVEVNWGDGSSSESIDSNVKYNHTFA